MRERPQPQPKPISDPPPFDGDRLSIEDFDKALERGSELLQRGEARACADVLEHALQFHPRHQRGRNLLGLSLFKLGELERSESIYRGLIEDHPEDATLRVNLGLVFLKSGSPGDAVRCFETAVDLQPGHAKAHNYLGLALAQLGEFGRAKECFDRAGNAQMSEKMAQAIGKPLQAVAEGAAIRLEAAQPFEPATEAPKAVIIGAVKPAQGWVVATPQGVDAGNKTPRGQRLAAALDALAVARLGGKPGIEGAPAGLEAGPHAAEPRKTETLTDAKPVARADSAGVVPTQPSLERVAPTDPSIMKLPPLAPIPPTRPSFERVVPAAAKQDAAETAPAIRRAADNTSSTGLHHPPPPPLDALATQASQLSDYTHHKRLAVPSGEGGFAIGGSEVVVHVHGEMLTRLDGLVASWGSMAVRPELKRFRGKATDKAFGEGARRMLRATGHGRFVVSREGRQFTALELGDEPAYFREEVLFAFEESLLFENGRVPSRSGSDLHLVHLRGHGKLLLATHGTPRAAEVIRGEPLRIPMDQLVGWHGPNIQPRLVPICEEAPELGVALELAGEGRALVDAPDEPR